MSLLRHVQLMLEQQYRTLGVNLEEFIVGKERSAQLLALSSPLGKTFEDRACTFLRADQRELRLAIFYPDALIHALEDNDPRQSLNERNISFFATFIEEIAHAIHAGSMFLSVQRNFASESCLCELEAMAKVETYLVLLTFARLLAGDGLSRQAVEWIENQVFKIEEGTYSHQVLEERYTVASKVAFGLIQTLRSLPKAERRTALRQFRRATWKEKLKYGTYH